MFVDRLVVTLIHLRHDLPHSVLALLSGVDRSTVTRAIGEIRGLLAERGCAVPVRPGLRLRTLADVFAYAQAEGIELRLVVQGMSQQARDGASTQELRRVARLAMNAWPEPSA
ncbi:helix-turn-helix domain-containing protein [Streptomyces lasalocidi]|uniref:helix-turn-helix domain-containing protein n=1 Tax=Streptomyces lasalocidi TaxID=324833 RepID=UPI0026C40F66